MQIVSFALLSTLFTFEILNFSSEYVGVHVAFAKARQERLVKCGLEAFCTCDWPKVTKQVIGGAIRVDEVHTRVRDASALFRTHENPARHIYDVHGLGKLAPNVRDSTAELVALTNEPAIDGVLKS